MSKVKSKVKSKEQSPQAADKTYHHGDLAASLIDATLPILAEVGPAQLSLRQIARIAGVSHGAPAHHFGDKTGLLTKVAIDGHQKLVEALRASQKEDLEPFSRLVEAGKAYVRFAVGQPGYFSVMFQPELVNAKDETYIHAKQSSQQVLVEAVLAIANSSNVTSEDLDATLVALWSQVHGFSSLWLAGNFGDPSDDALLESKLDKMLQAIQPRL